MSKYYNEYSLKEVLDSMIIDLDIQNKLNEVNIKKYWSILFGVDVASNTKTIRLNEGVLWVKIESASLKQELSFSKDEVKVLLNNKLGNEIIDEIIIY